MWPQIDTGHRCHIALDRNPETQSTVDNNCDIKTIAVVGHQQIIPCHELVISPQFLFQLQSTAMDRGALFDALIVVKPVVKELHFANTAVLKYLYRALPHHTMCLSGSGIHFCLQHGRH